jgi:protein SCO1/2
MFMSRFTILAVLALAIFACMNQADAQLRKQDQSSEFQTGVDEHPGALLPLDAKFVKEDGNTYPLAKFFSGDKPVVLTMNYSDCPQLCNLQLTGMVAALREIDLQPGKDFDMVSISINPGEGTYRAKQTKQKYITIYGNENSEAAWHFLTGEQTEIDRVATAIGFKYHYVPSTREYIHPPVFVMCSPDGRVMRYVHGIEFEPEQIREALVESGAGRTGNSISRFVYSCFLDRSYSGEYSVSVMKVMRLAGGMTAVILICTLLPFWFSRSKRLDASRQENDLTKVNEISENTESSNIG